VSDRSIGLVLSGGGARGAYEVGVLLHVARNHPDLLERMTVVTGSSVGAVNAAFLASHGMDPASVERLAQVWRRLELDKLIAVAPLSAIKMIGTAPLRLLRTGIKSPATGLIDASGLWRLVAKETDWRGIHRHVASGRFDAVAITATDIGRGDTHLFVDANSRLGFTSRRLFSDFEAIPAEIDMRHVLASAAIPFMFPPVKIGTRWYMDGGLRANTPLSPALRLGAHSLFIVNVSGLETDFGMLDEYPGVGHVLGKMLDAVFVDRVRYDLDRLDRLNDIVQAVEGLGPEAADQVLSALERLGRPRYRKIPYVSVSPEVDLGQLAAAHVGEAEAQQRATSFSFMRVFDALFENDARTSGDAASFLMFDGQYADKLIARGLADAVAADEELSAL